MAQPVTGWLGYDPAADRPLVKLVAGTKKLLTEDDSSGGGGGPHHTTHENGGSDEVNVAGLSGQLADPQTPLAHKTSHQDGGSDEINVVGLSGVLADAQKVEVAKAGTLVGTRKQVNFVDGGGFTFNVVDNPGSNRVDVTAGGLPALSGLVLQSVSTETASTLNSTTQIPTDNTIPQNTEGAAFAALDTTITPASAASLLRIDVFLPFVSADTIVQVVGALFRDSGANAISAALVTIESTNRVRQLRFTTTVTAGSPAATTFKIRFGPNGAATAHLNDLGATLFLGGVLKASLTVTEIATSTAPGAPAPISEFWYPPVAPHASDIEGILPTLGPFTLVRFSDWAPIASTGAPVSNLTSPAASTVRVSYNLKPSWISIQNALGYGVALLRTFNAGTRPAQCQFRIRWRAPVPLAAAAFDIVFRFGFAADLAGVPDLNNFYNFAVTQPATNNTAVRNSWVLAGVSTTQGDTPTWDFFPLDYELTLSCDASSVTGWMTSGSAFHKLGTVTAAGFANTVKNHLFISIETRNGSQMLMPAAPIYHIDYIRQLDHNDVF